MGRGPYSELPDLGPVTGTGSSSGLSVCLHCDVTACFNSHLNVAVEMVECCFTSTETVGLLGTGAQDGHLNFHTAPELCT